MDKIVIQVEEAFHKFALPKASRQANLHIGRAYSNDLILKDPYISANQLIVQRSSAADGFVEIINCDETNPLLVNNKVTSSKQIEIVSGDKLTVGRTKITFFDESHPVASPREFSFVNWLHNHRFNPAISIGALAILFAISAWFNYLDVYEEPKWRRIFAFSAVAPLIAFCWALAWATTARLMKNNYYFFSHLFFASFAIAVFLLLSPFYSFLDYYFSSRLISDIVAWGISTLLIGVLIGFNLTLMSHISGAFKKGIAASVFIFGLIFTGYYLLKDDYANFPEHSRAVMPQSLPTPPAKPLNEYIDNYQSLLEQLKRSENLIE